jgi:TolB-like protein
MRRLFATAAGVSLLALVLGAEAWPASAGERLARVAVFPVQNLSGASVPAGEMRQALVDRLAAGGIGLLDNGALEAFMARHRVRYTAGIDTVTAEALRQETGVDGVVIASIELLSDLAPPKVALTARLVSTAASPVVVWADDVGMAGDEAPGLLALHQVDDYQVLLAKALDRLTGSLLAYLKTGEAGSVREAASKFRPKMFYRGLAAEPGKTYSLAVVPFVNLSERRNAGEILSLLFMRQLSAFQQFRIVEPGVARRQLLDARIIMEGGLSLSDAETLAALVEADLVLGGRVLRYADYEGADGRTSVEFSAVLIDRKSRRVVWSSNSYNDGGDGVRFFGRGRSRTAHTMATQMARLTAELIAGRER